MLMAHIVLQCGHGRTTWNLTWFLPVERAGRADSLQRFGLFGLYRGSFCAIVALQKEDECGKSSRLHSQQQGKLCATTTMICHFFSSFIIQVFLLWFVLGGRCILLKCMLCSVNEMRAGLQRTKASGKKIVYTQLGIQRMKKIQRETQWINQCVYFFDYVCCLLFCSPPPLLLSAKVRLLIASLWIRFGRAGWSAHPQTIYQYPISRGIFVHYSGWYERIIETRVGHGFFASHLFICWAAEFRILIMPGPRLADTHIASPCRGRNQMSVIQFFEQYLRLILRIDIRLISYLSSGYYQNSSQSRLHRYSLVVASINW